MIYSSFLFIYLFLPVSLLVYYITPKKHRNLSLLILSAAFCLSFGYIYLIFITAYTAVNYIFCRLIEILKKKKILSMSLMTTAVIADVIVLFLFRLEMLNAVLYTPLHIPKGFMPIGISFITLSAVGTLADVYCGRIKAERSIIGFALYFMFFPRLIMGPLLRYSSFSKMLGSRRENLSEMGVGFMIFIIGFAKKVVIADSMHMLYTACVSEKAESTSALTAWLGVIGYLLCLYFTLSGLSDMGTGIGYLFGFRFPQSFNYPLFSSRMTHFAAGWHIQVVMWFKHYISRPLVSLFRVRIYRILVAAAVWALTGFWYTFSINGIIWGIIISAAVMLEKKFVKDRAFSLTGAFASLMVMIVSTVFFMGDSIGWSLKYLLAMLGGSKMLADSLSGYLLKSYIIILIVSIYASTSMFMGLMLRSGKTRIHSALNIISPIILMALMAICSIMISYSGSSDAVILKL